MAGFIPAIHVFRGDVTKSWMAGTSPAMTGHTDAVGMTLVLEKRS
jgi:hypothetical protein